MGTRPSGQGGDVELLKTDANSTALKAKEIIALVVQNVSVQAVSPVQTPGHIDPDPTSRGLRRHKMVYGQMPMETAIMLECLCTGK